jgi:hypothetical protein
MQALHAIEQSGVPWLAIVLRRCVGLAGADAEPMARSLGNRAAEPLCVALGALGLDPDRRRRRRGVQEGHRAAADPVAHRLDLEAHYHAIASPMRTAERFGVLDIIEPAATRPLLCAWSRMAYQATGRRLGPVGARCAGTRSPR